MLIYFLSNSLATLNTHILSKQSQFSSLSSSNLLAVATLRRTGRRHNSIALICVATLIKTWENQVLRVVMPISSVQSNIRIAINVSQRKDLFQHLHAYSIFVAEVIIFFAIPAVGRFVVVPGGLV